MRHNLDKKQMMKIHLTQKIELHETRPGLPSTCVVPLASKTLTLKSLSLRPVHRRPHHAAALHYLLILTDGAATRTADKKTQKKKRTTRRFLRGGGGNHNRK